MGFQLDHALYGLCKYFSNESIDYDGYQFQPNFGKCGIKYEVMSRMAGQCMLSNALQTSAACPVGVGVATFLLSKAQLPPQETLAPANGIEAVQWLASHLLYPPCHAL